MTNTEYQQIKYMTDRLIAFINWKAAPFESKKKKIVKEISLIKQYCLKQLDERSGIASNMH